LEKSADPSYRSTWSAIADNEFQLRLLSEITLSISDEPFDFSFLNQDGTQVTWKDLHLSNMVVVIEIMGSWCPNCLDMSRTLHTIQTPNNHPDLVIIPVAFEYPAPFDRVQQKVRKSLSGHGNPDLWLYGGNASKAGASAAFPMLNSVSAFLTLLFIDRNPRIPRIYNAFNGPGTGRHHTDLVNDMRLPLDSLLQLH
jgi:thiol-disulfide isomerase/thioredoxin